MIENPSSRDEHLRNLTERVATECKALRNRMDTYVKSVNGASPDASGNALVDVGVKTINNSKPDTNGNITLEAVTNAGYATKAERDASNNVITATYATKTEVSSGLAGKSDTSHTHNDATTSASGFMTADEKKKLSGIEAGANKYSLPTASSSTLGGVKTTSTVNSTSGLTPCPIISGVPYYKDTNTQNTLATLDVTATAAELNVLDGITATTAELNYVDGVTSNIQTQLNNKLAANGTAVKATADASGNNIVNTYATKSALTTGLAGKSDTTHVHTAASTTANGFMSSSDKTKLDGIATGANKYVHPTHTAKSNGFYKVTVDSSGHVSGTAAVTKADITGLGVPAQDTTYSAATSSAAGLMSETDKSKLDNIEANANKYVLPAATSSTLGGVKTGANITNKSGEISVTFNDVVNALGWIPLKTVNSHEADIYGNVDVSAGFFETDGIKSAVLTDNRHVYVPPGGQWFCFGTLTKTVDGLDGDYTEEKYYCTTGLYAGGTKLFSTADKYGSTNNNIVCFRNADGEWGDEE